MTGKPSLYPGLFIFTTPCRMVRPVRNLFYGRNEWIGTLEQVGFAYFLYKALTIAEAPAIPETNQVPIRNNVLENICERS